VKATGESLQEKGKKIEFIARNLTQEKKLERDELITLLDAGEAGGSIELELSLLKRSLSKPTRRSSAKIFQNHFDPRPSNRLWIDGLMKLYGGHEHDQSAARGPSIATSHIKLCT
jgi:hypothetical protein